MNTATAAIVLAGGLTVLALVVLARFLDALSWRQSLVAFRLRLPAGLTPDDIATWLSTVAAATHAPRLHLLPLPPVALEVEATRSGIQHLLLVPASLEATVLSGLRAALPGVRLDPDPDYLEDRPHLALAAEAVLTSHRRPLAHERAIGTAAALLAALHPLHVGERIIIQWIFTSAGTPAPIPSKPQAIEVDLGRWSTGALLDGEAIRAARAKHADVLLHASLRVGVQAASRRRAAQLFGQAWGQHRGLNAAGVLVVRRWWLPSRWAAARLRRLVVPVAGWPFLLGSHEAAGLLPLPFGDLALPGLSLDTARQLPPPPGMPDRGVQVAISNYPGSPQPLRLTVSDRLRHLYILGPTGTGKSTLLVNMVTQDIAAGHGVVVLDVLGDLTANILDRIPEERANDVIVLDPSAADEPVGLNILQAAHDEQHRELVVDHVIHIWHELYKEFWGPRTEDVLRGALLTLINTQASDGSAHTLAEVPELLTDAAFRRSVLQQATVPASLQSFWQWYQGIKPTEQLRVVGPILNKLRAATLRTPIRLMLGQSTGLSLDEVLAQRKVLLVPLRKGTLGAETSSLLGTLLLATIWQAVLGRVDLPMDQRKPVFVYVDEAQDVLKLPVDMADMLAQARGLGVGYILAHQFLGQVEKKSVKDALLGTVRSQIIFQCGRNDAAELAKSFEPRLTTRDLMNLGQFEIALRPCVNGQTIAPVTGTTLPLPPAVRDGQALAVASRSRYGLERAKVEAGLKDRRRAAKTEPSGRPSRPFGRRQVDSDSSMGGDS